MTINLQVGSAQGLGGTCDPALGTIEFLNITSAPGFTSSFGFDGNPSKVGVVEFINYINEANGYELKAGLYNVEPRDDRPVFAEVGDSACFANSLGTVLQLTESQGSSDTSVFVLYGSVVELTNEDGALETVESIDELQAIRNTPAYKEAIAILQSTTLEQK